MNKQAISVATSVVGTCGVCPRAPGGAGAGLRCMALAGVLSLLGACGQKGELTLPGRAAAPSHAASAAAGAASAASAPDTPWHIDPRRVP